MKVRRRDILLLVTLAAAAATPALGQTAAPAVGAASSGTQDAAIAAPVEMSHPATSAAITAGDISARVKILSDDAFEGRGPGTPAGERAAQWIADEMKRTGLKPGNGASYFQEVPEVSVTLDSAQSSFSVAGQDGIKPFRFADEAVWGTPQYASPLVAITNAPLVFVGYGVVAPEERWNDYAGVDVRGKVVVVLINDPGFLTHDDTLFKGRAMTYYGRWTYKFEEAARQGAAGVIIVHETEPAGYGWQVVRTSFAGAQSYLEADDQNRSMVPLRAWITEQAAQALFARTGLDYETLKIAANRRGFKPVVMKGLTASTVMRSLITHSTTRNVIGVIPGRKHPGDYLLYTAHWDHLGVKPELPGADEIYNGALDNAMGVSTVLEIGEAFAKQPVPPERSIAIICWTLEEQGLLGSEYFAHHPLWPISHIVGGVNRDGVLPEGLAHDLVVVGNGASELEDILARILAQQHRVISPDPQPEKGGFYRSDHISLAKVGIPMLYPKGGFDLINGGRAAGKAVRDDYLEHRYHQVSDEFDPNWDLSGPVDDAKVLYAFGQQLANSETWPNWYKGNEFRAIRDATTAAR
jgi:Zn-dependent M28 family amino/carboxypeptidase